jgi:hypothetical protein
MKDWVFGILGLVIGTIMLYKPNEFIDAITKGDVTDEKRASLLKTYKVLGKIACIVAAIVLVTKILLLIIG